MKTLQVNHRIILMLILGSVFVVSNASARSSLDGSLVVLNGRINSVLVSVDGARLGKVQPGAKRHFTRIPNGVRVVKVQGRGPTLVKRVSIPISGRAQLKVKSIRGEAKITNASKQRVRVIINGRYARSLRPGQSMTSQRLRTGRHQLLAYPARAGSSKRLELKRSFVVEAGEQTDVVIGAFFASIRVENPYHRRVALIVDGQRVGRIDGQSHMMISQLSPGMHRLSLRKRGYTVARIEMRVSAGQLTRWSPQAKHRSRLHVRNRARRPISVSVAGSKSTWIKAGASETFSGLAPGTTHVTVVRRHGRIEERTVRVPRNGSVQLSIGRAHRTNISSQRRRVRVVAQN
jgi:hypothetical protein